MPGVTAPGIKFYVIRPVTQLKLALVILRAVIGRFNVRGLFLIDQLGLNCLGFGRFFRNCGLGFSGG